MAEEAEAGRGDARARGGGLASLPPSRAAGRRQPGSARARGGGTSGASATAERTPFGVPHGFHSTQRERLRPSKSGGRTQPA